MKMLEDLEGVVRIDRDKRAMYAEGEMRSSDALRRQFQVESAEFIRTHHATICDMAARLEAAERDAARYRWLKMQSPAGFQHQIIRTPWTLWDAQIDKAMQEAGR